jgi:prepilin-type N-terminal cleavage/methylation domain-containing protein
MKNNKGFTLVELIAVIVVIVILAAIALPRIGDMQSAAGDAQSKASAATLSEAVERAIVEGSPGGPEPRDPRSVRLGFGPDGRDHHPWLLPGVHRDRCEADLRHGQVILG